MSVSLTMQRSMLSPVAWSDPVTDPGGTLAMLIEQHHVLGPENDGERPGDRGVRSCCLARHQEPLLEKSVSKLASDWRCSISTARLTLLAGLAAGVIGVATYVLTKDIAALAFGIGGFGLVLLALMSPRMRDANSPSTQDTGDRHRLPVTVAVIGMLMAAGFFFGVTLTTDISLPIRILGTVFSGALYPVLHRLANEW